MNTSTETIMKQQHSSPCPQPDLIKSPSNRIKLTPTGNIIDPKIFLKNFVFEKLLREKKLSLVLDFDHTLLHSVVLSGLSPHDRELFLKEKYDPSLKDLFRVKLMEEAEFVTKLRPGLLRFLEEASKMFVLHVFTKGSRDYATQLLKLIDPTNGYFGCRSSSSTRVFTRESCMGQKSLDLVMVKENGILVIDDQERVWRDVDKKNVMEIPMYNYFGVGSSGRKLPGGLAEEGQSDESETEGWLSVYLGVLKVIHAMYFDPQGEGDVLNRDVRVLKKIWFDNLRISTLSSRKSSKENQIGQIII